MKATNKGGKPDRLVAEQESEIGPLAVGEVAELLGIVPRTVIKYIDQGKLRAEKIGNRHRVWLPRAMLPEGGAERSEHRSARVAERSAAPATFGAGTVSAGHDEPLRADPGEWFAPLLDRLAALEQKIDALADELSSARDAYEEALLVGEETIAALRRRAEEAEGDHALLHTCLQEIRALRGEFAANQQAIGPWQRLRRFLIGTTDDDDDEW
jgi:excisionase family DNA binding protein